jgi:xylulokinase
LPVELTAVEEGSAYGAALLGGVAAGFFADAQAAVDRCVRVRERIDPEPDWIAAYESGYERFRHLYPAVKGLE